MVSNDIIIIAAETWDNHPWRRRHNIAWTLAREHRVLFVEPPYTITAPFRNKHVHWKQIFNLGRLKHGGRRLYSYSPYKLLPLSLPFSQDYCNEMNKKLVFSQLKRVVEELKIHKPILWTYFSTEQYEYYGLFDEILTITDVYDKFTAPFGWAMTEEHKIKLHKIENTILERSDIAFATSEKLYNDIKCIKHASYYVPHGVDFDLYQNKKKSKHSIYKGLAKILKPIIGYSGAIQHKIDFNLLQYMSESNPEWSLVFVGRVAINNETDRADWIRLINKNNVYHFKEIDRKLIPSVLDHFDVCMMPWKKIKWLKYGYPLKIWEYLAAGKPIVTINQNMDYGCNHLIEIVEDKIGFETSVGNLLSMGDNSKKIKERKEMAAMNSWNHRVQQMLTIIEKALQ